MDDEMNASIDHQSASELLPWLVNSTLSDSERAIVERHVSDCDECANDIGILRSMRDVIVHDNPSPLIPKPNAAKSLSLAGEKNNQPTRHPYGLQLAAAASLLIALLAVTLMSIESETTKPKLFETATGESAAAAMDYVFDLVFEDGLPAHDRGRILQQINARDVIPGDASNAVRTTLRLSLSSLEALDAYTQDLARLPEVRSASIVAVQLPVRADP